MKKPYTSAGLVDLRDLAKWLRRPEHAEVAAIYSALADVVETWDPIEPETQEYLDESRGRR